LQDRATGKVSEVSSVGGPYGNPHRILRRLRLRTRSRQSDGTIINGIQTTHPPAQPCPFCWRAIWSLSWREGNLF